MSLTANYRDNWFNYFLLICLLFILAILLTNCSCNFYQKKIAKKCGFQTDTTYVHDTTFVDKVKKDTIFKYFQKDTVIVREGRLTMKYFYNSHDSTVYLNGQCDTIKIVKEIPVTVTKYEYDYFAKYKWFILLLIIGLVVLYILKK